MSRKSLIWAIPLVFLLLLAAAILALPGFVSSGYHRNTIEALASSLTGRQVHIGGKLSLALLPKPELIAGNITITGPDHETITAKSLTLDISASALLRGQLSARSIMLQSPQITLPWPLPGGVGAVAPPPWLTALHAQINNGQITLGALIFQHVSADIFTGADGALSVSGTGNLYNQPLDLSLSLGEMDATGAAPLAVNAKSGGAVLNLSGSFNMASEATGTAIFNIASLAMISPALAQNFSVTAVFKADAAQISFNALQAKQGSARLAGTITLDLTKPMLNAALTGDNLTLPVLSSGTAAMLNGLDLHLTLDARNSNLAGLTTPQMALTADIAGGNTQASIRANLAGNTTIEGSATLDPSGQLLGNATLDSTGLNQFLASLRSAITLPESWQNAGLSASISGKTSNFRFGQLAGVVGPAHVTGALVVTPHDGINGQLHFDQLDVAPLINALRSPPQAGGVGADLEITADRAGLNGVTMTHLLVDAALRGQLVIRRITASVYGGLAAGSFTIAPDGQVTAARALLSVPSAAPLAALLPAAWQPPKAVSSLPLAISILAAGPATALVTSATATLGDTAITAAPILDLLHQTVSGALTLRHPSAITAFKAFGLNAGLAWPGAGSVSLRADMLYSSNQMGLPDFALSMGDLTATGKLILSSDGTINGELNADTLALPAWPDNIAPLWGALAVAKGKIDISAKRVLLAGAPILGPSAASISLQPYTTAINISHASLGGGALTGSITATTAANTPPSLVAKLSLTGADIATFDLSQPFPFTLPSGILAAQGDFTSAGYSPKAWGATLSGSASLSATQGGMTGFDLTAMTNALAKTPRGKALTNASLTGATPFTALSLAGNFSHGIYALSSAKLQSTEGSATATGNIDLPDQNVSLNLSMFPDVPAPPKLGLAVVGSWASPKKIPAVKAGISWKPAS